MKHGPEVRTADLRFEPGLELASMILTRLRPDQLNTVIFFEVGTTPQLFFVTKVFLYGTICLGRVLKLH